VDGVAFPIRAQILADSYVTKRLHSTREEAEKQLKPPTEQIAEDDEGEIAPISSGSDIETDIVVTENETEEPTPDATEVNAAEPGHNNAAVKPTEKRVRKSYERKASESDYH